MAAEQVEKVYREIGQLVQSHRQHRGLTQHQLAAKLPLRRSTLANLERGRHRIMLHDLIQVSKQFGLSARQFLKDVRCLDA